MLVGLELMRSRKICIDVSQSRLSFQRNEIRKGIVTTQDEIIPARSQTTLLAKVNAIGTILEIPHQQQNGLILANAVSEVRANSVLVVVLNPLIKDVKIAAGTQLAGFELIEKEAEELPHKEIDNNKQIARIVDINDKQNQIVVGDQLSSDEVGELIALLEKHLSAFSLKGEIGITNVHEHRIELESNTQPIAEALRRRAQSQIEETRKQVS